MTNYGKLCVEKIIPHLVNDGWTIVSGLMYGIDQAAHEQCLKYHGRTIAVLGWGINYKSGEKEQQLIEEIITNNGLVVSLWEDQMGTTWTFPTRNKVVADICHELIVIEAAAKSGALHTAKIVAKLGKKVWAVPGPITSQVSVGTNKLIAEKIALPWLENPHPTNNSNHNFLQTKILKALQNEELTNDEIIQKIGIDISKVSSELSVLLLLGAVVYNNGRYSVSQN